MVLEDASVRRDGGGTCIIKVRDPFITKLDFQIQGRDGATSVIRASLHLPSRAQLNLVH